eukprot:3766186-Amphidinium_carterae.1
MSIGWHTSKDLFGLKTADQAGKIHFNFTDGAPRPKRAPNRVDGLQLRASRAEDGNPIEQQQDLQ